MGIIYARYQGKALAVYDFSVGSAVLESVGEAAHRQNSLAADGNGLGARIAGVHG